MKGFLALLIAAALPSPYKGNIYPMTAIVTDIVTLEDEMELITIVTSSDVEFQFEAPIEDCWYEGDIASCLMDKNGTDIIYDDIILEAYYAGGLKQFEEVLQWRN